MLVEYESIAIPKKLYKQLPYSANVKLVTPDGEVYYGKAVDTGSELNKLNRIDRCVFSYQEAQSLGVIKDVKIYRVIEKEKESLMKNFYLIVGLTGSGKDTIISEITAHMPIKILKSYSTRPKRFDSENTHTFISKYKFGKLKNKIAVSVISKEWYGTTEDQIEEYDIGAYDNNGAKEIINNYRGNKKIKIIYIDASENIRLQRMLNRGDGIITSLNRIKHDADVKEEVKDYADIIINNDNCDLQQTVQAVVSFIKEKENEPE